MKRGLIALVSLLLMPLVSAETSPFEVLAGTTNESMIFLKLMYGMLVFVIIFKASKQFMFKEQGQKKLGTVFSLLIAIFTFRFTPDSVVQAFGWVIMVLAPFLIIFIITGVFQKKVTGEDKKKLPWVRILLSLIATIILFAFVGTNASFGGGVAGSMDELFSDAHYLMFSKIDTMWVGLIGVLAIAFAVYLLTRLTGRSGNGTGGGGNEFGNWFFIVLGIVLLLGLIGMISGFGFGGLITWLGGLPWGWIIAIAVLIILLYFPFTRRLLMGLLSLIGRGMGFAINRGKGNRLFVFLRTPVQNIKHEAVGAARTIYVEPTTAARPSVTPLQFTVYKGRWQWSASPIENAHVELHVNNGTIAPSAGNTNARGMIPATYTAPNIAGRSNLNVRISHPDAAMTILPPFEIQIGIIGPAVNVTVNSPIDIDKGNPAEIIVQVTDLLGNGVDNANVSVTFTPTAGMPAIPNLTGVTLGGGVGTPAAVSFRTPVFNNRGTFNFIVRTRVPGTYNPPDMPGVVNVNDPGKPNLEITNRVARTGTNILTLNASPPANPLRIGETFYIEATVTANGVLTNGANLTIAPITGFRIGGFTRAGTGVYRAAIASEPTVAPTIYPFIITAEQTNCNSDVKNILVEVRSLARLNATPIIPAGTLYVGSPVTVQIQVTNSETGNPVNRAPVEIRRGTTSIISGSTNPAGIFNFTYNPTTAGNVSFNAIITPPAGYGTGTNISFTLTFVPRLRDIGFIVSWYPSPVKKVTALQLVAIDLTDGRLLKDAIVEIVGPHSVRNPAPTMITDNLGRLNTELLMDFSGLTTGSHNIQITISHRGGYIDRPETITIDYNPTYAGTRNVQTRQFI